MTDIHERENFRRNKINNKSVKKSLLYAFQETKSLPNSAILTIQEIALHNSEFWLNKLYISNRMQSNT